MPRLWLAAVAMLLSARAAALDLCPIYGPVHASETLPRLKSGIPFKLLSVAAGDGSVVYRRIVRLTYDLWDEKVTVEALGQGTEDVPLGSVAPRICRALSFPEAAPGRYRVRIFLNPVLGKGVEKLRTGEIGTGLLQVNWDRVLKEMETEKMLLDQELSS